MRRRTVLAAAWSAPVAIVATAAPAVAASGVRDVLVFTNCTATEGKADHAVYVNLKVMTTTGDPVPGLTVTVALGDQSRTWETGLDPWGATDLLAHTFEDVTGPAVVTFHASAPGCTPITATVTVPTPAWWS